MIEMVELANILNNATPKSLILLDEIGRAQALMTDTALQKPWLNSSIIWTDWV